MFWRKTEQAGLFKKKIQHQQKQTNKNEKQQQKSITKRKPLFFQGGREVYAKFLQKTYITRPGWPLQELSL